MQTWGDCKQMTKTTQRTSSVNSQRTGFFRSDIRCLEIHPERWRMHQLQILRDLPSDETSSGDTTSFYISTPRTGYCSEILSSTTCCFVFYNLESKLPELRGLNLSPPMKPPSLHAWSGKNYRVICKVLACRISCCLVMSKNSCLKRTADKELKKKNMKQ